MRTGQFDATSTLAQIRAQRDADRALRRRQRPSRSRLAPHHFELVRLREAGATLADLAEFLRGRGVKISLSTIARYLAGAVEARNG